MTAVVALAYLAGALYSWPSVYRFVMRTFGGYDADNVDRAFGVFLGTFLTLVWPLLLLGRFVSRHNGGIVALLKRIEEKDSGR